jgi:DNA-binding CsgD family transcriptional regulator
MCMFLLTQGKTYKEIGNYLNISHRTVEQYINNIKIKTGTHYKTEIIECVYNNFGNIIL